MSTKRVADKTGKGGLNQCWAASPGDFPLILRSVATSKDHMNRVVQGCSKITRPTGEVLDEERLTLLSEFVS
jgi:hypothetical protein